MARHQLRERQSSNIAGLRLKTVYSEVHNGYRALTAILPN